MKAYNIPPISLPEDPFLLPRLVTRIIRRYLSTHRHRSQTNYRMHPKPLKRRKRPGMPPRGTVLHRPLQGRGPNTFTRIRLSGIPEQVLEDGQNEQAELEEHDGSDASAALGEEFNYLIPYLCPPQRAHETMSEAYYYYIREPIVPVCFKDVPL